MVDDPQTPLPAATNDPATAADQKNPLDVLEELLKDSQASAAPPAPAVAPAEAAPVLPPEPPGPTPEEIHQMELERAAADQVALQAKLSEIQAVEQTPEFQARIQQDQAAAQQQTAATTAHEGFEITQLDHTKIP